MTADHLNINSYISLGVVVIIMGATLWINNRFNDLVLSQATVNTRLAAIENAKILDKWSSVDQFKWAVKLQQQNPNIKVPEPKHEE